MVKFSKELEAQLIPEWKDAFVNYWLLKKHVKKIKLSRKPKHHHVPDTNYDFGRSIFDPVRALLGRITGRTNNAASNHEIIQVKSRISTGEDGEDEELEVYETELVQLFSEEDEVKVFFEMLDDELNKVNQFYKNKESEFLERGEILNKQLQILLDLKRVLGDRRRKHQTGGGSAFTSRSTSSVGRNSDFSESQSEYCDSPNDSQTDDVIAALEKNGINFVNSATRAKTKKGKPKMAMRIDIPATTPTRTIAAVTSMLWEDLVNNPKKGGGEYINRKKIQCAEKMIRGAFVELYRGLGLLKTYSSLNMVAFTKILKKFDKVANQQASASYLKVVKRSHFISSDKVVRLMDEVESLFTQHFANSDRKKAMKFLRPQHHKDSHMVTFFVGLFTGSFVTLFSVYAILAHLSGMFSPQTEASYMETVYPVFRVRCISAKYNQVLMVVQHVCITELALVHVRMQHVHVEEHENQLQLHTRIPAEHGPQVQGRVSHMHLFDDGCCWAMVIHLILLSTGFSPHQVDLIPGILLLCFFLLLICPLNVFYRPTRFCFLRVIRNIVCSPFYKVLMVDFFMADQLTSQPAIFLLGVSKRTVMTCKSGKMYRELAYIISFAPYYWRAMQCARRWFDECNIDHLANLGKYVSAMVAAGARLTYARQPSQLWMIIVLVTSVAATVYQLYWDFIKDWGLLKPKSKNPWLRDDLILKNKGIYYASIALNFVLRVAWVETVMRFNIGMFESRLIDFLLASLEVIRRGHWNYYRLENEHLNNVGKFRAVKTVPLPFRETDSDG
ncbi:UNVERIFIED_CONTAM: Phosphate transporter [Sesamum latifolium]|uniref:Phosphate transporter n=1 Tax=Sesamum latifolium TaxID=2727402 RepID=A0AAW2XS26_9LAMI